ncbi:MULTISPECIES: TraV family lipoprotein [Sphingobium]|uniref:TraV family lipoprotein n=1 Tax=Sphingobium sp. MI1205 TaxID=407020 RepID=UPI000770507B|nr:TraV family lipoprotein [Sphingobium sp. MI1205]AMK20407.1 Type IV conjugative transfer system protein TraV [Sphingobium sp. MI1205]
MMRLTTARPLGGAQALASLLAIAALSGCVGLGGNIKGSFACQAPDGICAPSAVIDDRALALISDDPSVMPAPAAPYRDEVKPRPPRLAAVLPVRGPINATPGRSNERVLRIVFPAYVDQHGRLHEASAVHAVISQGEWLTWTDESAAPARNAMTVAEMPSLAEAMSSKEAAPLEVDPNLPDPAIVAAARARNADPVAAIKADVSQRLKPSPRAAAATNIAAPAASSQAPSTDAPGPATPVVGPTVRAASFPATVAEDQ